MVIERCKCEQSGQNGTALDAEDIPFTICLIIALAFLSFKHISDTAKLSIVDGYIRHSPTTGCLPMVQAPKDRNTDTNHVYPIAVWRLLCLHRQTYNDARSPREYRRHYLPPSGPHEAHPQNNTSTVQELA